MPVGQRAVILDRMRKMLPLIEGTTQTEATDFLKNLELRLFIISDSDFARALEEWGKFVSSIPSIIN